MKHLGKQVAARLSKTEEIGMAGLGKKATNLPCFVCVRPKPDNKHKMPSIKVRLHDARFKEADGTAVISVEDIPKRIDGNLEIPSLIMEKVSEWILLNRDPLIQYWNNENILTDDLLNRLKRI